MFQPCGSFAISGSPCGYWALFETRRPRSSLSAEIFHGTCRAAAFCGSPTLRRGLAFGPISYSVRVHNVGGVDEYRHMHRANPHSPSLQTLMDSAAGAYEVITSSGAIYVIDLDRSRITRRNPPSQPKAHMRKDGESVALVAVIDCTVGRELNLTIDLGIPGVAYTSRVSTPVHTIRLLDGASEISHE